MSHAENEGPNVAAFVLVVAGVSVAFASAFQLTFSGIVADILTLAVMSVTILSLGIGMALEFVGYFGPDRAEQRSEPEPKSEPEPDGPASPVLHSETERNKPLSPLLNFDEELRTLTEPYDSLDDAPEQLSSFVEDYRRLKSSTSNRESIASDLRAGINPLTVIVADEHQELVEDMGERLHSYINASADEFITIRDHGFYRNGKAADIQEVQGEEARFKVRLHNEGEAAKIEVLLQFTNEDGVVVRRGSLPVGTVQPNASKELNTHVYVPSLATDARISVGRANPDEPVLDM